MSKTLLIDGDIFIYKAAFAAELSVEWTTDVWTVQANLPKARDQFRSRVMDLEDKFSAKAVITLSDQSANWRKELCKTYKEHRIKVRRPTLLKTMRDWVREQFTFYQKDRLEADDVMGILATTQKVIRGKKLIVTIDKDLLQVPGFHLNPDKLDLGVRKVSEKEGHFSHMFQTLTGDTSDNYPGCPGVGKKRGTVALEYAWENYPDAPDPLWMAVLAQYRLKDLFEADALLQARLAYILRAKDYNPKTGEVKLWAPPSNSSSSS